MNSSAFPAQFPGPPRFVATASEHAKISFMRTDQPFSSLQSSGLEAYLAAIRRLPVLSAEDLEETCRRAAAGDRKAQEQIVLAHLGLVVRLAFFYSGYGLPLADLVAEGNLGLLRAAELFDPRFRTPFSVYASVWIKQRLHRAITAQARVVRIPVWRSQRLRKLDRLHADLSLELGRDADLADLAGRLGISEGEVARMASDRIRMEDLENVPEALLAAEDSHPTKRLSGEELREEIIACLQGLDDTELQIVARKFGLLDREPESYREMAPRFGRSREWIRRIGESALAKLRSSLAAAGNLPRAVVEARRKKARARLRALSAKAGTRMSVFQMMLMQWLEPLIL